MSHSFLARITPVGKPVDPSFGQPGGGGGEGGPVDPDYGIGAERPMHPIALPPLPGIWPPPGQPALPIVIPPEVGIPEFPNPPIAIDPPTGGQLPIPPGEIWPPLDPIYTGKVVAIIVLGEGKVHWYVVPPPTTNPAPPVAQPKRP